MIKAILSFFRKKKKKRSSVSIEFPRGRRMLSPGIQPTRNLEEELFYGSARIEKSKDETDHCTSLIDLGDEINPERMEKEGGIERIPLEKEYIDRILREQENEFDPEEIR